MSSQIPQDYLKDLTAKYGVSDAEFEALALALEERPTLEIAKQLGVSDVAIRKRLGEVYSKFNIVGGRPGKIIELKQFILSQYQIRQSSSANSRQDWGEAPEVNVFYGRTEELKLLQKWILTERCKMLALLNLAGAGKTTLTVQFAKRVINQFEYVIWRSLRNSPTLSELLTSLIQFFCDRQETDLPENSNAQISRLLECLQAHRCLIILDDFETLLETDKLAGYYRSEYEGYRDLLQRVAEVNHQSCLVFNSSESPAELDLLDAAKVRILKLKSSEPIAREIFKQKGLSATAKEWQVLVSRYRDNLLAFKMMAATIKDFFNGNVAIFLESTAFFVEDTIVHLLEQQFERLSKKEEEILYWLAIKSDPVSLFQLKQDIFATGSLSSLLMNLESLERRCLIEKKTEGETTVFDLQPLVRKFVANRLIDSGTEEFCQILVNKKLSNLQIIKFVDFSKLPKGNELICSQNSLGITQNLKNNIHTRLMKIGESKAMLNSLNEFLSNLPDNSPLEVGYARDNVRYILKEMKNC